MTTTTTATTSTADVPADAPIPVPARFDVEALTPDFYAAVAAVDKAAAAEAERAGISPQYLSEIERGIKEPSSEMIAAIAGALDTSLIELTSAVADELRTTAPASAAVTAGTFALAA